VPGQTRRKLLRARPRGRPSADAADKDTDGTLLDTLNTLDPLGAVTGQRSPGSASLPADAAWAPGSALEHNAANAAYERYCAAFDPPLFPSLSRRRQPDNHPTVLVQAHSTACGRCASLVRLRCPACLRRPLRLSASTVPELTPLQGGPEGEVGNGSGKGVQAQAGGTRGRGETIGAPAQADGVRAGVHVDVRGPIQRADSGRASTA
jgi:hypothetical protein